MPEGPEVRAIVKELQAGAMGQRFMQWTGVSGRYVKNGPPDGYQAFASTLTPASSPNNNTTKTTTSSSTSTSVDLVKDWNCKGKFIYILLDDNNKDDDSNAALLLRERHNGSSNNDWGDFQRSIWITLGMTGQFLSEAAVSKLHQENKPNHVRWCIELMQVGDNSYNHPNDKFHKKTKIYYSDTRGFGTIKFCLSRQALMTKLQSLGPDMLTACTEQDFLHVVAAQRNPEKKNVCRFLMDQSNLSGIGNYILAEGLYRANVDPFASLSEMDLAQQRRLFRELQSVSQESYRSQTPAAGDQADDLESVFEYQCYGQDVCKGRGNPVYKDVNGPHGRTIWYTKEQLFMPRRQRESAELRERDEDEKSAVQRNSNRTVISATLVSDETIAKDRPPTSTLAAANTPGNAKLAALLNTVRTDASGFETDLADTELPNIAEETVDSVLLSTNAVDKGFQKGSSTAASASTAGNAKLASILANKGARTKAVDRRQDSKQLPDQKQPGSMTTVPNPLVSALLNGVTESGWRSALCPVLEKSETVAKLALFLEEEGNRDEKVYPPFKEIFAALNLCPIESVKVVIVGQDPYHGPGQGHGLAFSVRKGVRAPPSLQNIFKELIDDIGIDEPLHGNLECWSRQGVLMINTVLTVRQGQAFSHANQGWEEVTDTIIRQVSAWHQTSNDSDKRGLVFLLWGNAASNKVMNAIDMKTHSTILTSHPSPLGATKTKSPFLGSKCFSKTNKALLAMGHDPINWSVE